MMPLPPIHPVGPLGQFRLQVPEHHPAFAGHFPGHPVLPGVVQVDWAIRLGQATFGDLGTFARITQLKFLRPIGPSDSITLVLSHDPERRLLAFSYEGDEGRRSSGTVGFEEPA